MNAVKGLKIVASIPLVFALAVLLLFTVGETAGGDWSGLGHLFTVIPIALLLWLGWKKPLWGGILLVVLSLFFVVRFFRSLQGPGVPAPVVIYIAPLLISGALLLVAARLQRKAA